MESVFRHAAKASGILAAFTIVGTALLALTYLATKDIIAETEKKAKLALVGQILPREIYDNDLIRDAAELPPAKELGNADITTVHRATMGGQPAAAVIEAVAPDGYSGKIKLLIAIRADGELSGVRVVAHNGPRGEAGHHAFPFFVAHRAPARDLIERTAATPAHAALAVHDAYLDARALQDLLLLAASAFPALE